MQIQALADKYLGLLDEVDKKYLHELLNKEYPDFFETRVLIVELPHSIRNVLGLWVDSLGYHPDDLSYRIADIVKQRLT